MTWVIIIIIIIILKVIRMTIEIIMALIIEMDKVWYIMPKWLYITIYGFTWAFTLNHQVLQSGFIQRDVLQVLESTSWQVNWGVEQQLWRQVPRRRYDYTLFFCHTKWVSNNDENYGSKLFPSPPTRGTIVSVETCSSQHSFNSVS